MATFEADSVVIASAVWRDPVAVDVWLRFMPRHRDSVVYCAHGHEISKNTCSALRGADAGKPEIAPQSAGLLAISLGLSALHADDHQMLDEGMNVYDALYAWTRTTSAAMPGANLSGRP